MVDAKGRRLSAVLLADFAEYTKLVEQDTDGTVAAWTAVRSDVIIPAISAHGGQIVKYMGDGFLAEFSSVQNAVECAISMQSDFAKSSLGFRIGIGLVYVVDDGMDIHGEGVNIAARIEALAEQGDICVAAAVRDAVKNRVSAAFEDMGEHAVKHVSTPIRIYRIVGEHSQSSNIDDVSRQSSPEPSIELSTGKPSIAVLPFENMSGDPEQEYFADGVVEEIITALAATHDAGVTLSSKEQHASRRFRGAIVRNCGLCKSMT
jgi:adenylate cyclase